MPMPMYGGGGGGGGKSNALLIIGLLCCCCVILPLIIYLSLWGTNTICDKTKPDDQPWLGMNCASVYEASPAPAPALRTPATTTSPAPSGPAPPINLLTSETTFSQANPDVAATTQPTVSPTSSVVFTISMDMDIVAPSRNWREIFQSYAGDSWVNNAATPLGNTPLISIVPTDWSERVNQMLFRMLLDDNSLIEVFSAAFVPGTYSKLTVVCNDTTLKIYTNGTLIETKTTPAGRKMKWRATNNFTWNPTSQYWIAGDTVKVKNAKWWNRALTDAEVSALGTSTYMPQPLSMGTSAYVKDDFASY